MRRHHPATARRSFGRTIAAVAVVVATSLVAPVGAQTDEIEGAKAEREAARAEAAELASELDPLLAEDAELEAAVAALELYVSTQQAKLDATQQSLAAARDEADAAAQRVVDARETAAALRLLLGDRAVAAYVSPDDQRFNDYFSSDDLTVAVHKRALLDTVSGNDVDLLDQLRAVEDELVDLEAAADEAVELVATQEQLEIEQLDDLEESLGEQARLKEALEDRITDVSNEIVALEATEDELTTLITNLIAEEEARVAAEAEARRRAEEAARIAAEQERLREESGGDDPAPLPTAVPLPAPPSASGISWPASGQLTSPFGPRWGRQHQGIDIAAPTGTAIWAAGSGTVINAGPLGGYGNMVLIDHGGGFTTTYGHLSEIWVTSGQSVGQGETIGLMGCTGTCTGPHLHFETRVNGVAQDPMLYL